MVQEKVVSISTTLAPDSGTGETPFLWEVVDGIVSPDAGGGLTDSRSGGSTARSGGSTRTGGTLRGTTTTSVAPSGGGSSSTITLPANQIYVDLYPDRGEINVFSTSGNLSNAQSFVVEKKEIVVFSKTDRVSLRYGDISNESVTLLGSFLDVNGNVVSPSFNIDGGTFELVSSIEGYGAVEVTYSTSKKRYLFEFVGACPATIPVDSEGNEEEVFEQATLLALWQVDDELRDATIDVTNPNNRCSNTGNSNVTILYPDEDPIGFQLINEGTSGALEEGSATGAAGSSAITRIKVFPGGAFDFQVTVPTVDSFTKSSISHKSEIKNDLLQFQNTFQQTMTRSISNGLSLSVSPVTDIVDQFGNNVSVPKFVGPGGEVTEVEWTSSTTFRSSGRTFIVPLGTVISVNSFNDTLPITGTCSMSYTAPYDLIFLKRTMIFDDSTDTDSGDKRNKLVARESNVSVLGSLDGQNIAGTIAIPEHDGGNKGTK